MKSVMKLKKSRGFIVEEWMGSIRIDGKTSITNAVKAYEYVFKYQNGKLYATENTDEKRGKMKEILDAEKTLADLAKEECILCVNITPANNDSISFNLYNPRIRFLNKRRRPRHSTCFLNKRRRQRRKKLGSDY